MVAKFKSKAEVDEYLSGDKIVCLECGKAFRILGLHVSYKHSMSPNEYKIKYGIPVTRGIIPPDLVKLRAEQTHLKHLSGEFNIKTAHLKIKTLSENGKWSERCKNSSKKTDYHIEKFNEGFKRVNEERKYKEVTYIEFLNRLKLNRSVEDVCLDEDMPTSEIIYRHAKADKEFSNKLKAITFGRNGKNLNNIHPLRKYYGK